MSIIYQRVIELCHERNITKTTLEHECGFSQNSINKWQSRSYPAADKLMKVADFFDVSVDYLLGRENQQTKKAVPMERPESDLATIENIKGLLAEKDGMDIVAKLYRELHEHQKIYVLTWLVGYMMSEGLPVNKILGK